MKILVEVILKNNLGTFTSQKTAAIESLGAEFSTVSAEDAAKMGIDGGVQVTNIQDGILRSQTRMRPGFVITKVGDQNIKSMENLKDALSNNRQFPIQNYSRSKEIYYYSVNDFEIRGLFVLDGGSLFARPSPFI